MTKLAGDYRAAAVKWAELQAWRQKSAFVCAPPDCRRRPQVALLAGGRAGVTDCGDEAACQLGALVLGAKRAFYCSRRAQSTY